MKNESMKFQQQFGEVVKPWIANLAKEFGIDITGYKHKITGDFKRHVMKQHGNSAQEALRGNIVVTEADLNAIDNVMNNPDIAAIGIYRHKEPRIVLVKNSQHGCILIEEVLSGNRNKALNAKTFWIMKYPVTAEKLKNILESAGGYEKIKIAATTDANSAL